MNIIEEVKKNGIDNCIFLVKLRQIKTYFWFITYISDSESVVKFVPSKITEDVYDLKNNYKITLKSIEDGYEEKHFYIKEIEDLIDNGDIIFLTRYIKQN